MQPEGLLESLVPSVLLFLQPFRLIFKVLLPLKAAFLRNLTQDIK